MNEVIGATRGVSHAFGSANSMTQQFLTFRVGSEEYGVDIMTVREIKGWTETTRLPNSPPFIRGVINLRGLIIPIFDLRARFHGGMTEATPKHVVIILAVGARNIGLLVDAVSDILDVTAEQIKPAPTAGTMIEADFIGGLISVEERMTVLLDIQYLFDPQQIDKATEANAA